MKIMKINPPQENLFEFPLKGIPVTYLFLIDNK